MVVTAHGRSIVSPLAARPWVSPFPPIYIHLTSHWQLTYSTARFGVYDSLTHYRRSRVGGKAQDAISLSMPALVATTAVSLIAAFAQGKHSHFMKRQLLLALEVLPTCYTRVVVPTPLNS